MKNSGSYNENVRIVQIDTHFVETDAVNFRAVVQSLTGKNSSVVWGGNGPSLTASSFIAAAAETGSEAKGGNIINENSNACFPGGVLVDTVKPADQEMMNIIGGSKDEDDDYVLSFMKLNNLSFKDFDRLLSEFALREELPLL